MALDEAPSDDQIAHARQYMADERAKRDAAEGEQSLAQAMRPDVEDEGDAPMPKIRTVEDTGDTPPQGDKAGWAGMRQQGFAGQGDDGGSAEVLGKILAELQKQTDLLQNLGTWG